MGRLHVLETGSASRTPRGLIGEGRAPDILMRNVLYSMSKKHMTYASRMLMDKWTEQALAHKISIVGADTGNQKLLLEV